jgi:hypothetical protein
LNGGGHGSILAYGGPCILLCSCPLKLCKRLIPRDGKFSNRGS